MPPEDVQRMRADTGVQGVMIGRAAGKSAFSLSRWCYRFIRTNRPTSRSLRIRILA